MSTELQLLHEARRLLKDACAEKKAEEARVKYLEARVCDSWTARPSGLTDNVLASERLGDNKIAARAKDRLKEAIQQHKNSRQWDQIRGIRDHIEGLEILIEAREYVVDRLEMRVDEREVEEREGNKIVIRDTETELDYEKIQMRDTVMEREMRSGDGGGLIARCYWQGEKMKP